MVNTVVLTGRLTRDPELKHTQSGTPVARFSLAVDRRSKGPNGEKQTDFIRISCWGKVAELVAQYLAKGRLAAFEGALHVDNVTQPDGSKREYAEVVCNSVTFLESAKNNTSGQEQAPPPAPNNRKAPPPPPPPPPRRDSSNYDEDDDVPF